MRNNDLAYDDDQIRLLSGVHHPVRVREFA